MVGGIGNSNNFSSYNMEQKMTKKADKNGDTSVDSGELNKFLSRIGGKSETKLSYDEIMKKVDTNADGRLDENELKGLKDTLPKPQGMHLNSRGQRVMQELDKNKDGSIDNKELSSLLTGINKKAGTNLESGDIIKQLDTNGDGKTDADEIDNLKDIILKSSAQKDSIPKSGVQSAAMNAYSKNMADNMSESLQSSGSPNINFIMFA